MGFFKEDTDLQMLDRLSKGKKPRKSLQGLGRAIVRKVEGIDAKNKRIRTAVRSSVLAESINKNLVKRVEHSEKIFAKSLNNLNEQIISGQTQKPAKGANQNNPPKNVRFLGNNTNGYKLGDPRTTPDTVEKYGKSKVKKYKSSFDAVMQINEKLNKPTVEGFRKLELAAETNKAPKKPKAANTNYTKKAVTAIKTMGKIARGSSIIGVLSYAASSTPVGDATIHKGFKQKEFKRK